MERIGSDLGTGRTTVLVAGDSIAVADNVQDGYRWHQTLTGILAGTGHVVEMTIAAHDGAASADYVGSGQYRASMDVELRKNPSLVIVCLGANDWLGQVGATVYANNMQTMLANIVALTPSSTLMVIHHPWIYDATLQASRTSQQSYEQQLRMASNSAGGIYVPMEWLYPGNDLPDFYTSTDPIHPDLAGQYPMAALLWGIIMGLSV